MTVGSLPQEQPTALPDPACPLWMKEGRGADAHADTRRQTTGRPESRKRSA